MTVTVLSSWTTAVGTVVAVVDGPERCLGCNRETRVRIDGQPGHYGCIGAGADAKRAAALTAPQPRREDDAGGRDFGKLRLLAALEKDYPPKKRGDKQWPWWRPRQPDCLELVQVVSSWSWSRPYPNETVTLDRSGAWISAASSVEVAHGGLEHTGPGEFAGRPGFYLTPVYPWLEEALPHPLGRVAEGQESMWVPAPRMTLLRDLAREGRWPDVVCLDSWTGEPVRLAKWATYVNGLRAEAIARHGRDSEEYDAVKVAFSQAIALMLGSRRAGQPREWEKSPVQRTDWAMAVQDQGAVNLWRAGNKCLRAGVPPVAMRNVDELVLPAWGLEKVTAGEKPAVALDPTGVRLGTFKVKGEGE